jgi:adenine-specific DNA-methyltransferase
MTSNSLKKGRYTQYSNKIGLYSNSKGSFIKNNNDVVLSFPFKDTVLEAGMTKEDVGRDERFLHLSLDSKDIDTLEEPKVLTNFKYIDKGGEKVIDEDSDIEFFDNDGNLKQNLLIKGNNLLALYTLRERLAGKVKLIYIDPPYNTGNDGFKYNDSFNHSSWLTFMKNRLEIAKDLLSNDGAIFVSCDDNEQAYLKVLLDEAFGRENFVNNIIWEKKFSPQNDAKWLSDNHDFITVFAKNKESWKVNLLPRTEEMNARYKNPDNDPRGNWTSGALQVKTYSKKYDYPIITPSGREVWAGNGSCWRFSKEKLQELINDNRIWFGESGESVPRLKRFLSEVQDGLVPLTLWRHTEVGHNQQAKQDTGKLELNFSSPKPESLIKRIIEIATLPNDIVLDYHLGSGTTSAVAHKMGRRWIGIEQMDYIETIAKERMKKVISGEQGGISKAVNWQGEGSFVYLELKKYNQEYVDRIIKAESKGELDEVYNDMSQNAFLKFWFDKKEFEKDENFRSLDLERRKELLIEILDENQLYLNYADMNDSRHKVTIDEKTLTNKFYGEN